MELVSKTKSCSKLGRVSDLGSVMIVEKEAEQHKPRGRIEQLDELGGCLSRRLIVVQGTG